ncbi:MAG: phospholipid transport system transporter-binding protein [Lysobacterales bacterium]|jgi:phospholipid transport system transporter-binding protein
MSLQANQSGELSVSGALTFESVATVYAQSLSVLSDYSGAIDLADLSSVDSAGLALLLEWQALAQSHGARLVFENAPSELQRLAALSNSSELLGITQAPHIDGDD